MRKRLPAVFARNCQHSRVLVVESVGVRREVCEDCGNVSFVMDREVSAAVGEERTVTATI